MQDSRDLKLCIQNANAVTMFLPECEHHLVFAALRLALWTRKNEMM